MKSEGFNLIELVVVMAILALLTAISYPAYTGYVKTTRRADAKAALATLANAMERNRAANDTYAGVAGPGDVPRPELYKVPEQIAASYQITVTDVTPTSFVLRATPKGAQRDDDCGELTLNQTGFADAARAGCW